MDKKVLKFYEAPSQEVVELKASTTLLSGSTNPDNPFDGNTADTPVEE